MDRQEQAKKMGQVIAKVWADEGFKKRLISNPSATLKEQGLEIPPGVEVRVVENTDKVFHMVLPPKPSESELSDKALEKFSAAGAPCSTAIIVTYGSSACSSR